MKKMKNSIYVLLTLLPLKAFCQKDKSVNGNSPNIDPRQYVKVFETDNTQKKILIWSWNNSELINQKRKIVDAYSTIQIEFDKKGVSDNTSFKGNITIEGQIVSAKGGKDPVEVLPYSRIGEEKRSVGLTSRPPTEISTIFINLLEKCIKITSDIEKDKKDRDEILRLITDLNSVNQDINNAMEEVLESNSDDISRLYAMTKELSVMGYDIFEIPPSLIGNPMSQAIDPTPEKISKEGVLKDLARLLSDIEKAREKNEFPKEETLIEKITGLNAELKVILQYINYFKSSGEQAEDAFLSFIQLDYIALDNIEEKLKRINLEFNAVLNKRQIDSQNSNETLQVSADIARLYNEAIQEIKKVAAIESTIIGNFLSRRPAENEHMPFIASDDNSIYSLLISKKDSLITYIAHEASRIIYLNLDYATIDLLKERANEGDYLYLFVVLEETERRAATDESKIHQKILPIGRYELRNTGWRTKISDSFILANRIDEPNPNQNPNVSPSNFKGAPGATLLLTRRKDGSDNHKVLNALQPSFGVDVSYIDFNRSDDVEVGVGVVLGFFDNKLFLSSGINLNSTGKDEGAPFYFGVGFSFANLAGNLIKN